MVDAKRHQPHLHIILNILPGGREEVNALEIASLLQILPQPLRDLLRHSVPVAPQLLSPVLGQVGHSRLGRIPVARAVPVQVGGAVGQPPQRVAKDGDGLARHGAAQLDAPVIDPLIGRGLRRRRAEKDGARHPPAGAVPAETGDLPVKLHGPRAAPSMSLSITGTQFAGR